MEATNLGQRQLYRHVKNFKNAPSIQSVLPTPKKILDRQSKLDKKVLDIIKAVINDFYLSKSKPNIKKQDILQVTNLREGKAATHNIAVHGGQYNEGLYPMASYQIDSHKLDVIIVDERWYPFFGQCAKTQLY